MRWRRKVSDGRAPALADGSELAIPVEGFPAWSSGAPLPHVVADGHTTILTYLVEDAGGEWDGTEVTVKDAASGEPESIAVVRFDGCAASTLGPPNDEALRGHRLWGSGLTHDRPHVVTNSTWIADIERRNRVHPHHAAEPIAALTHYILTFHDETFECLARSHTTHLVTGTYRDVLIGVVDRLTRR